MQLFDLKTKYQFQTQPGVDQYNMPMYTVQSEGTAGPIISLYPVYQGFFGPAYINGVQVPLNTEKNNFVWPNVVQQMNAVGIGDGTAGPYNLHFHFCPNNIHPRNHPFQSLLRGHIDLSGIVSYFNATKTNATTTYEDPPLITTIQIESFFDFIQSVPVTSVFPAVYISSIDNTGSNVVVSDSGQFLAGDINQGLMMEPGKAPNGNLPLPNGYTKIYGISAITQANPAVISAITTLVGGQFVTITGVNGMNELNGRRFEILAVSPTTITIDVDSTGFGAYVNGGTITLVQNTINYLTGKLENLYFPAVIPQGNCISSKCFYYQCGLPRSIFYYNNTIKLISPPDTQYLIELDAYLSPAAFLNSSHAIPFGYMAEYIARGAARKILSDTGDIEQFQFYEPLFREQELLVWKRSQRIWTSNRTQTIYSQGHHQGHSGLNSNGGII